MITLKEFMEIVDYRITEGSDYTWDCFGDRAYTISAWNGEHNGWSFNITFSTKTQEVFVAEACDYKHNRAYRIFNHNYKEVYKNYAKVHNEEYMDQAWDDVNYVDLDVDDDFIQKALAIIEGKDYDTRVQVEVDFSDEDLLKYMKLAHEMDITFNELVERAIKNAVDEYNKDPEGMISKARAYKEIEPHGY